MHKIIVLAVDGLNPEAVRQWLPELAQLKKMQQEGIWGRIESTVPPTAPQAWISSQCGQNPGAYGLWGYTYRDGFCYDEPEVASSRVIDDRVDSLYNILPKMGQKVALINVPLTWPPLEIPGGYCISDFAPDRKEMPFIWPESLGEDVRDVVGEYIFEALDTPGPDERTDKSRLLKQICDMDEQKCTLVRHFIREKRCDYVFARTTGVKIINRLFSKGCKPDNFVPYYEDVLRDYYHWIDARIGEIRDTLDSDTGLFVFSPYSSKRREGYLNLNEWLIHNGYMTLYEYPRKPTAFSRLNIDWTNTRCWSIGESGKIYVNLKDREKQGILETEDYDVFLDELSEKISQLHDTHGKALGAKSMKREDNHFGDFEKYGPDLFIRMELVPWNTNDRVGYGIGQITARDEQEEYDNEYNGMYGYFSISGPGIPTVGELPEISLLSIAPTVMEALKVEIPAHMEKPSILSMVEKTQKKSPPSRKEKIRSRLQALGY